MRKLSSGSAARRSRGGVISVLAAAVVAAAPTTTAAAAPASVTDPAVVQPATALGQRTAQIGVTLVTVKTTDQPNATYDVTGLQNNLQSANSYWQTVSANHISLALDRTVDGMSLNLSSTADFSSIVNAVATNLKWVDQANKVLMVVIPNANVSVSGFSGALGVTWMLGSENGRIVLAQPSNFTAPVMTHELGHVQGLGHANTLQCTDGAMDSQIVGSAFTDGACSSREYGDNNSIMGISQWNQPYLDSYQFDYGG
ncbi:MAG: hypothetical protein ACTHL9_19265, partial [Sinomonas sp.]